MISAIKGYLKKFLYYTGVMRLFHWVRNRNTFTVVMFHRILSPGDPRWLGADMDWTVSTEDFRECLRFFVKYYNIISLDILGQATKGSCRLPPRSLLITFDDGWGDNEEYALPILQELNTPFVVFVAGAAIGRRTPFLPEALCECWRLKIIPVDSITAIIRKHNNLFNLCSIRENFYASRNILDLLIAEILRGDASFLRDMEMFIFPLLHEVYKTASAMLSIEQIKKIVDCGGCIGGHGFTHVPLVQVNDCAEQLVQTRSILRAIGGCTLLSVESMSFPHGKYNDEILNMANKAGYSLLFNSVECLFPIDAVEGALLFGRINIPSYALKDSHYDNFDGANLAFWLFTRRKCVS